MFSNTCAIAVCCFVVIVCCQSAYGANDSFSSYEANESASYQKYSDSINNGFKKYQADIKSAFKEYQNKVTKVWGVHNAQLPNSKRLVEYDDNLRERRVVDFKNGKVKVAIALSLKDAYNSEKVKSQLENLIVQTLSQAPDRRSIIDIAKSPSTPKRNGKPLLGGLVNNTKGKPITAINAEDFAKKIADDRSEHRIVGGDGKPRVIISAQFNMISNYLLKLAQRYRSSVIYYASRSSLDPHVVFAMIETESDFNPYARSDAPAFGLMQLVPYSGARAAYEAIHGHVKIVSDRYLYNPVNNIDLGTTYLHLISSKYFGSNIKDNKSRLWCAIAAYNTGPTNVLSTFAGNSSEYDSKNAWRDAAFRNINKMNHSEVFRQLRRHLPYKETRDYIVRIKQRMPKYNILISSN